MRFKVKLITSGGGKRELELPATSVQDAIDQANSIYKGCTIEKIDLIPQRSDTIIIFSHGEQFEENRNILYNPFPE